MPNCDRSNKPILVAEGLAVGYREGKRQTPILEGLELSLERGRMVALLGKNGAGKSTLLRALTLSSPAQAGEIRIDGKDIASYSQRQLSRLIGLVTTTRQVMGALTVRELVELGRQPHTGLLGRLSRHDHEVVADAMAATGIAHKAEASVTMLSDGERQKVMIARALAQETPIIILDEPTAFLDVASRVETMRLLHSLARDLGKAVLLSSHDISQSLLLADDLWVITRDRRLVHGSTEEIVARGTLKQMFDSENLTFNEAICDYEALLPTTAAVRLNCDDKRLRRIAANALMRNGIAIDGEASRVVTCHDYDRFTLGDDAASLALGDLIDKLITPKI